MPAAPGGVGAAAGAGGVGAPVAVPAAPGGVAATADAGAVEAFVRLAAALLGSSTALRFAACAEVVVCFAFGAMAERVVQRNGHQGARTASLRQLGYGQDDE